MTSAYSVRPYTLWGWGKGIASVSPPGEEYVLAEVKFLISSTSLVSAVNHMAARALEGKENNNKKPSLSFHQILMSTLTSGAHQIWWAPVNLDNREKPGARNN